MFSKLISWQLVWEQQVGRGVICHWKRKIRRIKFSMVPIRQGGKASVSAIFKDGRRDNKLTGITYTGALNQTRGTFSVKTKKIRQFGILHGIVLSRISDV